MSQPSGISIEILQTQELESGATVKTETTWTSNQLGPIEFGAIEGFFRPALDLLQREK